MGGGKRFNGFQYSAIPGPGNYKIPGFSDNLLRDVEKRKIANEKAKGLKRMSEEMESISKMTGNNLGEESNLVDRDNSNDEINNFIAYDENKEN